MVHNEDMRMGARRNSESQVDCQAEEANTYDPFAPQLDFFHEDTQLESQQTQAPEVTPEYLQDLEDMAELLMTNRVSKPRFLSKENNDCGGADVADFALWDTMFQKAEY